MIREKYYKKLILLVFIFGISTAQEPPKDADGWYQAAVEAREAGQLNAAFEALEEAEKLGLAGLRVGFERARLNALADRPDDAVAELQSIADTGFTSVGFIVNDPILSSLAGNPAYDGIVAAMNEKAFPCESDEAFRAFDFWVGDWDVHVKSGQFVGTNTITRAERGCVLIEKWTNSTGGTGMSINYLDKVSGEWVQIWNSEGGSQIYIRGGMTGDGMRLVGTLHTVGNNTTVPFRGLWTPLDDGRVRQYFEQSSDGGGTWVPWFEGFYTRKE